MKISASLFSERMSGLRMLINWNMQEQITYTLII